MFSLVPNASTRVGTILDIAANSQEELKEWVHKIREVTMTSEAKVNTAISRMAGFCEHSQKAFHSCSYTYQLVREEAHSRLALLAVICVNANN